MSIGGLIVALVLFCLVIWAVRAILAAFKVPDPIATLVFVLVVVFAVLYLLGYAGIGGVPRLRL